MKKFSQREETDLALTLTQMVYEHASIKESWQQFSLTCYNGIEDAIDEYISNEFKKTQTYSQIKFLDDTYKYLKDNNALSPEKEEQMSNTGDELDQKKDEFENDFKQRLEPMKHKIFNSILESLK